jgi:hypothetical protein
MKRRWIRLAVLIPKIVDVTIEVRFVDTDPEAEDQSGAVVANRQGECAAEEV